MTALTSCAPDSEVALTTDIIVGFPGRERTGLRGDAHRIGRVRRFDEAYTFKFSPRDGTRERFSATERSDEIAANGWAAHLPDEIASRERNLKLLERGGKSGGEACSQGEPPPGAHQDFKTVMTPAIPRNGGSY